MKLSQLAFLTFCIVLSILSSSIAHPLDDDETHLTKRSDDNPTSKIVAKALETCSCYGIASLSPQLCLSNCLHTMTPLDQQEAANHFTTRQEFAAYASMAGVCFHCARIAHDLYKRNRREMKRQREEHRRQLAQNVLDAQDLEAERDRYYDVDEDEDQHQVRIDVPQGDQMMWPNAPQPMEPMDYQGADEIPIEDEYIDASRQESSTSGSRRRIKGSSSRAIGREM